MRVSLAWYNYDDLDLHCEAPGFGHIYFHNKCDILDIDMNAGHGRTREAVENMRWISRPRDGTYRFYVNNYARREAIDTGFEIEIEGLGLSGIESLHYEKPVPSQVNIEVAKIIVKDGVIADVLVAEHMTANTRSQEVWGLRTQEFARVNSILLSPNYWDTPGVLNKQLFFILEGCRNPLPARGFYNEMLRPEVYEHRKVFEVLADKTKCPVADEQLSGVGYSLTQRAKLTVLTDKRPYTICF